MNSTDASRWLPRLAGFGTIMAVLAMLLQLTPSTRQVLLPLTATSRTHRHRLTARSAGRVAGARLPLPFNYHMMRNYQVARLGSGMQESRSSPRAHAVRCRAAPVLRSAVPEVRADVKVIPVCCGVVVELDRLSTGLRQR